jgi:predicted ABC-type ATPase
MKVRIIIGPNGSGKSTIFSVLKNNYKLNMGAFINADEIEKSFKSKDAFSFPLKNIHIEESILKNFLLTHSLNSKFDLKKSIALLTVKKNTILLNGALSNSYISAAIADYLRELCLYNKQIFSFESVFSDERKVNFIKKLHKNNYKIYLYVISTVSPFINIARVNERVKQSGHAVAEEKIIDRYYKSLRNIKKAIPFAFRSFIIDNSQEFSPILVAELNKERKTTYLNKEYQPNWVKQLL